MKQRQDSVIWVTQFLLLHSQSWVTAMRRVMCLSNFTDRNSFAETVCTPFWNLIVIGKISLDFVAKTLTKNLHFVARLPMNYYKRILQAWIVSCLSIPVLDALYKAPQIEFGKYHLLEGKKDRHRSKIRPFILISTRVNMRNRWSAAPSRNRL